MISIIRTSMEITPPLLFGGTSFLEPTSNGMSITAKLGE